MTYLIGFAVSRETKDKFGYIIAGYLETKEKMRDGSYGRDYC